MATMVDPRPLRPARRDPRLVALAEDSGYEIQGRIGAGGMGIVYRGRDADGNDVAIKLLRHEISDDPRARERLAREVAAQQRVRNDNIVRILDAELDSGDAFVVTEFIPGPTLEDAVHTHGGLHPEAVREIGLVMGETLRDIHAAGVVHRDLKPSNVLLRGATEDDLAVFDPDGDRLDPVIIDFGIAIAAEESRLTSTGLVMGTAAYLDPEVVRTNHTGEAGDWWAWAALLAFAATGREPYGGGRADLVFLRAERGEIDVEGTPTELAQWLRSALQADPEQRPRPEEMIEGLAALDLSYYDDPGPTEAFAAGPRTAALPVAAGASTATSDGAGGSEAELDEREGEEAQEDRAGFVPPEGATEVLPAYTGSSPSTGASPYAGTSQHAGTSPHTGTSHRPQAGQDDTQVIEPVEAPTAALPVIDDPAATQRLPAVPDPSGVEQPPQRIDRQGPATEALPVMGTPTRQMPAVRPDQGPPHRSGGGYPVQRAPQADPYRQPVPQARVTSQPGAGRPAMTQSPTMQPGPPPGWPQGHAGAQAQAVHPGHMTPGHITPGQMTPYGPWQPPVPPPPRRPLLVWTGHLLLIGLAAVAPYVPLALLLVLGTLARTWERSHQALAQRRLRGASGSGASFAVGAAAPLRLLLSLVEIVLQVLLPLVLGLLVGIAVDAAWTVLRGAPPPDGIAFAVTMAMTLLITWVGIGSRTTRAGAHRMVDAAAPDRVWTAVVAVLLLLLVIAVATTIVARGGVVDYFPFGTGPRLDDIAIWRR